jgi:hypothetical protein
LSRVAIADTVLGWQVARLAFQVGDQRGADGRADLGQPLDERDRPARAGQLVDDPDMEQHPLGVAERRQVVVVTLAGPTSPAAASAHHSPDDHEKEPTETSVGPVLAASPSSKDWLSRLARQRMAKGRLAESLELS